MKKLYVAQFVFMGLLLLRISCGAQTAISNFGSNPGAIQAFEYVPANMPAHAPLVLVLHGCTQTASSYSIETQWNDLADRHKFYVCYGQQTEANNSSECFNYYVPGDITRGQGEALSLKQITDYMKANYSIDSTRVFVTGLSAGAAMTCVMCCTYPDVFSAGAEMSGLPYQCANSLIGATDACLGYVSMTPAQWGALARAGDPGYTGPWPRMAIFHGSADVVVSPENDGQVINQFTNLYGISQTPGRTVSSFNANSLIQLEQFFDSTGHTLLDYYLISGMPHATAVDTGTCYEQGGTVDVLAYEEHFYSPFWAAQFFGILIPPYSMSGLINISVSQSGLVYSVPYTAGSVYTWTVPPGATIVSGQGTDSVTVNWGTTSGTISVTEMPTGGCELGPVSLFVTVGSPQQPLPDAGLSNLSNPPTAVCSPTITPVFTLTNNGSITITTATIYYKVDNNAYQTYSWAGSLTTSQSDTITLPAISVSAGSHVLTIFCTQPNGQTDGNLTNDTVTKSFTAGVTPVVNLGNNVTQCGGSVSLNAQNTGDTYSWSNGATAQTVSVTQSNTYTVTVSSNGCSATGSVDVTINALPVITLASGNFCAAQTTLNAGNSGSTYSWSTNATTQSITVTTNGSYQVTVTNANHCTASASTNINLNSNPGINLGPGGAYCGTTVILDAGNPGYTFSWSTGATTESISTSTTGTYTVTVTGGLNCSSSASVNISAINPVPVATFTVTTPLCIGQNGTVTYTGQSSNAAVYTWNFDGATILSGSVTGPFTVNWSTAGPKQLTLNITDNGCVAMPDTVLVNVNSIPVSAAGDDTTYCTGDTVNIGYAATQGYTYLWSPAQGLSSTTISNPTVSLTNPTNIVLSQTYTVTTNNAGCTSSEQVTVTVNPIPVVSLSWQAMVASGQLHTGGFVGLSDNDTIICLYNLPQGNIEGGTPTGGTYSGAGISGNQFTGNGFGHVEIVTYTYAQAGCSASAIDSLLAEVCEGITTIPSANLFTLYPNPADEFVMLDFDAAYTGSIVFVKDITGRQLFTTQLSTSPQQISTGNLPPGAYLVMLYKNGQVGARLLVRE